LKNLKQSKLLIKSITPGEYEIFKNFTDKYYFYLLNHPKTLLTPIFGVFTLSLSDNNSIPPIHFIVMKSVFDPSLVEEDQKMIIFDLKGSVHGRSTLEIEDYEEVKNVRTCSSFLLKDTLKDIDFTKTFGSIEIPDSNALITQIKKDTSFLTHNNFMDYSLLMFMIYDYGENMEGIETWEKVSDDMEENKEEEKESRSQLPEPDNISSFKQTLEDEEGYKFERHIYFGIIDYLTSFGYI